jgi:hypothetical protein
MINGIWYRTMPKLFNASPLLFTPVEEPARFGASSASFVVKGTFDIMPGAPAVPSKEQKPFGLDQAFMDDLGRSLAWPSDLVPWKPNTDFFIIGAFHQPGGVAAPEGRAGFRFGPLRKELRILGPRIATRRKGEESWSITPPAPVTQVPLRWELSRGGLRDRRNPYGLGGDPARTEEGETLRLPLIEGLPAPDQPANFAPVPPIFLERARKLGTRDQRWSLFRAPLPPEDFDPSHVNAAPQDQQAGDSPRGDEAITLVNLHRDHPELTFFLPGLRARVAVLRQTEAGVVAEEVAMRIDTVAVLPEEDRLVLLWRGVLPLPSRNLDDTVLMAECAVEPIDTAAPADPDLPRRLFDRYQAGEDRVAKRAAMAEQLARAQMLKLLPKAKLPPAIAALIEGGAEAGVIVEALSKHIIETGHAILAKLPKP